MNEEHPAESDPDAVLDGDDGANEAAEAEESSALEVVQAEIDELKNELLRGRAEVDNIRKRAERDVEAAHKYGQERLAQDLLPVKDSIDMGLEAATNATDIEGLKEGMALTAMMFSDFFAKLQIRSIDPGGERFDPEFHQAMMTEEASDVEAGTVLRVMQQGYVLNDRLLRPALVVVAKAPAD